MRDIFERTTFFLLLLILIDLICTIIWYEAFGISEWNPILSPPLEKSSLRFCFFKLALSIPSIWVLVHFKNKLVSKIGIALLSLAYTLVVCVHIYIAIYLGV